MKNPFEILGISVNDIGSQVESLIAKEMQLEKVRQMYESIFRNRGVVNMNKYTISDGTVEGNLNERFILGLPMTSVHFTDVDIESLLNKIDELKLNDDFENFGRDASRTINQSLVNQSKLVGKRCREYSDILNQYRENPDNPNVKNAITDLYMRQSYEEQLVQLAQEIVQKLPSTNQIGKDNAFMDALKSHPKYKQLSEAYGKVATAEGRRDCIPELYVLSRLGEQTNFSGLGEGEKRRILDREEIYKKKWLDEKNGTVMSEDTVGYPENQNHDYGWGMVLQDPRIIMKDEYVDTSDFEGKITVENLGAFASDSLFKKVHNPSKIGMTSHVYGNIDSYVNKLRKLTMTVHDGKTMRKVHYKHQATKTIMDYIYRVTKTDTEGKVTRSIVFSPLHPKELEECNSEFIKQVYFSDYALARAKENNGYAGRIEFSPKGGYSISNEFCEEELAAALLFESGISGRISDTRGGKKNIHKNVTNADFLRILNAGERERTHDE